MAPELLKPNIPAWKRLGLKLKSAQQESVPYGFPIVIAPVVTQPLKEKKKRGIIGQEAPLGKRVKRSKSEQVREPKIDTTPLQLPVTSSHRRRKSVTFTAETKTDDGDSIKQLYNDWAAKNPSESLKFLGFRSKSATQLSEPTTAQKQIKTTLDDVLQEVKAGQKSKKAKKAKPFKSQKAAKVPKQVDSALSYLKLFHESKDSWKFNKIHQVNLLRNAFDIEKIPSEYIEIFYSYVAGLKGRARTQLRDAAIAIKVNAQEEAASKSAEDMDSDPLEQNQEKHLGEEIEIIPQAPVPKRGYEEEVLRPLSDLTVKQGLAKRMRAERILDELAQETQEAGESGNGGSEPIKDADREDHESQKRLKMSDGSTQRVRRKRKQRTNTVDDSSSSASSESESSSEDDDERDEENELQEPVVDESSSSSSSSSSTSEDDEDSASSENDSDDNGSE